MAHTFKPETQKINISSNTNWNKVYMWTSVYLFLGKKAETLCFLTILGLLDSQNAATQLNHAEN